jgi:hypothetical protein
MSSPEFDDYVERLDIETRLEIYIPRRFTAATLEGGADADLGFNWRGILRDREPGLEEILKHPRLVVLGEPGAGKSLVARAAVQGTLRKAERVPVFTELKQYRGDLRKLLEIAAPRSILDQTVSANENLIKRVYILDGVDEIPQEFVTAFGKDLEKLLSNDSTANALLTARQAFYVSQRTLLPEFPAVFHILDFSDDDIRQYLDSKKIEAEAFLEAVPHSDAEDEIRNPFVLSVMGDRFKQAGALGKLRSENLSYIIERLIESRPLVNRHRQRRALCMIAVAFETYCRNELDETEVLRVIKQSMRITDDEAKEMLNELHASILKRTVNGFAFQMRSYGEYLAAEALEFESVDRLRELAFLDYDTPNDSWVNTVGYLVEMNSEVRKLFAANYPFWVINSSPAAFSDEERARIVRVVFKTVADENYYIYRHPRINLQRLGRFLTSAVYDELRAEMHSARLLVRGNALVLLSLRKLHCVVPEALDIVSNRGYDVSFRQCALLALQKAGGPDQVPDLIGFLDPSDPLNLEILDTAGAICDESQITTVLPLLLAANSVPAASVYHFREFRSRWALVEMLRYFAAQPHELNKIRAEAYFEPILKLLPNYWNEEIGELCVEVLQAIEEQLIYPDNSGVARKLFRAIRDVDTRGIVSKRFLEKILQNGQEERRRWLFVDEVIAELITLDTAQWLIDNRATVLIKQFSGFLRGLVRDRLRPFSEGLIDLQEENSRKYAEEQAQREGNRKQEIVLLKEQLSNTRDFSQTLSAFYQLSESHWAELSADHKAWLAAEVSKLLVQLDLEHSIVWNGDTLSAPATLHVLLRVVDRYELIIDPDTPLAFAISSWDEKSVANYYRRHGLSATSIGLVEGMLTNPPSPRALSGIVGFVRDSGYWSPAIRAGLMQVVSDPIGSNSQTDALSVLVQHDVEISVLEAIASTGASAELKLAAFAVLVERQHRGTIERALYNLIDDEQALRIGESEFPFHTSLGWIAKINSEFAVSKLVKLRARTLQLALPNMCGLVTEALVRINRAQAAQVIKRQIAEAPPGWKQAQQSIAQDQERTAKIEMTKRGPFETILAKLKGATSIRRLKLWCEGSTDVPVFRALLGQVPDTPEILFDSVGGWEGLRTKEPEAFQHGCYEAIVVMDGDRGRQLTKHKKPLTQIARAQNQRFDGLPVSLHILQRYGIENYFPQARLEAIVGQDLTRFFPIPDHIAVREYLRIEKHGWLDRLKRFLVSRLHLKLELSGSSLYAKSSNAKIAQILVLDDDLSGTDLWTIIHLVANRARTLSDI